MDDISVSYWYVGVDLHWYDSLTFICSKYTVVWNAK